MLSSPVPSVLRTTNEFHIHMRSIRTIHVLLASACVAGCAAPQPSVDPTARMLDTQFGESAQKIDRLLGEISKAGALSARAQKVGQVAVTGDLVTVRWQGDAPEVLKRLADAKGLSYASAGRAVPLPVSLEATNTPFLDVLQNIGTQLGGRADVVLKTNALEIRYLAP